MACLGGFQYVSVTTYFLITFSQTLGIYPFCYLPYPWGIVLMTKAHTIASQ